MHEFWILIILAGFSLGFIGCSTKASADHPFLIQRDSMVVKMGTFYAQVKGYGLIEATQAEVLSARFDGHISFPQQRSFYAKGDIIYRLTDPDVNRQKKSVLHYTGQSKGTIWLCVRSLQSQKKSD